MSTSFKDNKNREWSLSIDVPLARQIRDRLSVDILDIEAGLQALSKDPILFVDVLYLICQEQCEQRKLTDEDFGRALVGDVLEAAADAFWEALMAFSPPRQRTLLTAMAKTSRTLEETLTGMALQQIPEAMAQLQSAVGGRSSPATPASSDTNQPAASAS